MIYICERCGGYEPDTSHGPVCPDCAIERHLFDESKLKELLDKSEERKLRLEVSTLGVQLDAWHAAFGTKHLSRALARLEAAERRGVIRSGDMIARELDHAIIDHAIIDHALDAAPYHVVIKSQWRYALAVLVAPFRALSNAARYVADLYRSIDRIVAAGICKRIDRAADVMSGRVNHQASGWVETDGEREEGI